MRPARAIDKCFRWRGSALIISMIGVVFCTGAKAQNWPVLHSNDGKILITLADKRFNDGTSQKTLETSLQVQEAMKRAADMLSGALVIRKPVNVTASFAQVTMGTGGEGGPTKYHYSPDSGLAYPKALAKQLDWFAGHVDDASPDMTITFNTGRFAEASLNLNGKVESGKTCSFVDIVVHELIHGFGFNSVMLENGDYVDNDPKLKDIPSTFDALLGSSNANIPDEVWKCPSAERVNRVILDRTTNYTVSFMGSEVCSFVANRNTLGATDRIRCMPTLFLNKYMEIKNAELTVGTNGKKLWNPPDHWADRYIGWLTEASTPSRGYGLLDIRLEVKVLEDCGWALTRMMASAPSVDFSSSSAGAKSMETEEFYLMNNSDSSILVQGISVASDGDSTFGILSGGGDITIPAGGCHCVELFFEPHGCGYHRGYLTYRYPEDGTQVCKVIPLGGYGIGTDTDGDGICDDDEERDLDPITPGIQTPFSSVDGDVMGDNGQIGPDGIPDGENDWDGDGYSNAFEFEHGMDPTQSDGALLRDSVSRYVKLSNTSTWPVRITSAEVIGDSTGSFFLTEGTQSRTVESGKDTYIAVAFAPQVQGALGATVRVHYENGFHQETRDIPVSGGDTP